MAWKRMYSKSGGLLYFAQIVAIALAQREDGAPGAEHLLPEMREGLARGARVHLNGFGRCGILRGRLLRGRTERSAKNYAAQQGHPLHSMKPHRKLESGGSGIRMSQFPAPPQYFLVHLCGRHRQVVRI